MGESGKSRAWEAYRYPILLLVAILIGGVIGWVAGPKADVLKPFGDIFINLMFTIVVPLVFVNISSAVASIANLKRLGKILGVMLAVFVATGIVSSVLMIVGVSLVPCG